MNLIFRLLLILSLPWSLPAGGLFQTDTIRINTDRASSLYPFAVEFSLGAQSDAIIDRVTLIYSTSALSCFSQVGRQDLELKPSKTLSLDWTWDLGHGLPPGAEVTWQWEIHDSSGVTHKTDPHKLLIEDSGYTWNHLEQAPLEVMWSEGRPEFGRMLLSRAVSSLERLVKKVGVDAPDKIWMVVYPSQETLRRAALNAPEWAGGVAYPEYNSILMGIPTSADEWAAEVIPHELAHLVIHRRIFNCQGNSLPTWMDEGLAVYAEGPTRADQIDMVRSALKRGALAPFTRLTDGFSADSNQAELNYAQSGMLVTFIIDSYGPQKMDELLGLVQGGTQFEDALRQEYGLDTDGLDLSWRASLGFGVAPSPSFGIAATPTLDAQTQIPTLALWTAAVQTPSLTPSPTRPGDTPTPPGAQTPVSKATAEPSSVRLPGSLQIPVTLCVGGAVALLFLLGVLGLVLYLFVFKRG